MNESWTEASRVVAFLHTCKVYRNQGEHVTVYKKYRNMQAHTCMRINVFVVQIQIMSQSPKLCYQISTYTVDVNERQFTSSQSV